MPREKGNVDDAALLAAALEGLEMQKARIDEQIRVVKARLGRKSSGATAKAAAGPAKAEKRSRRPLSEAARKRIAAAQKKRWATFRKTQPEG